MIELEGTREKLDKEKIAFKMVSFRNKVKITFFISYKQFSKDLVLSSIFFVV